MVGIGKATEKQRGRAKLRQEGSWRAGGEGLEVDNQRPKLGHGDGGAGGGSVMESVSMSPV